MTTRTHVGTLAESPLHAALKRWYARPGDRVEEPVDGYVIDLVRGGQLIEIQTRNFSAMKRKLHALLEAHPVHVVHPIAVERYIVKLGDGGEVLSRRRSPKRGIAADLFAELVSFPGLVDHERFTLELAFTREEEIRVHDPAKWRRRGWATEDRRLLEVVDTLAVASTADLAALIPDEVPREFTTADLAAATARPRRLAQRMAYCLRECGAVEVAGKDGNAVRYRRLT